MFTLSSLFLGFLALLQILKANFTDVVLLLGGSVLLDGFDGTVARLTKTESNFGVQLDSLVDAVTFGLVSSILVYYWGFKELDPQLGKVIGFLFLSAGIIRLARFNVLKEAHVMPSNIFVGLPIPLGALSILSAVLVVGRPLQTKQEMMFFSAYVILVAFLMISSIKYRALKRFKSKYNLLILLALAIIVALSINFTRITIPAVTLLYIISPIIFFIVNKLRKTKPATVPTHTPVPEEEWDTVNENGQEQ